MAPMSLAQVASFVWKAEKVCQCTFACLGDTGSVLGQISVSSRVHCSDTRSACSETHVRIRTQRWCLDIVHVLGQASLSHDAAMSQDTRHASQSETARQSLLPVILTGFRIDGGWVSMGNHIRQEGQQLRPRTPSAPMTKIKS